MIIHSSTIRAKFEDPRIRQQEYLRHCALVELKAEMDLLIAYRSNIGTLIVTEQSCVVVDEIIGKFNDIGTSLVHANTMAAVRACNHQLDAVKTQYMDLLRIVFSKVAQHSNMQDAG